MTTRFRRLGSTFTIVLLAAIPFTACMPGRDTPATDTIALKAGDDARQQIPAGVDPRMVEWRGDGVLIASRDSLTTMPGYVIDSVFPPEEAMRRFRAEIAGVPPTHFSGGARSMDALLKEYWARLVAGDTIGARTLTVSKAEFAYLYLPGSPEFRAGMPPAISWLLLEQSEGAALVRALAHAAQQQSSRVVGSTCSALASDSRASIHVFGPCGVIVQTPSHRDTAWIARRVVQHRGVAKLLSFDNTL